MMLKNTVKSLMRTLGYRIQSVPTIFREAPQSEINLKLEHLASLQFCRERDFFFVQVGAFDGLCVDPIHKMIRRYQWKGLLIEPEPRAFTALQSTYKNESHLTLLNAAISDRNGTTTFYRVKDDNVPGMPCKAYLVSSLDREKVIRNIGREFESHIEPITVPCLTLASLFEQRGIKRVDLLQIDAEGYDFTILKSLNFEAVRPAIINFEHALLSAREQHEAWQYLVARDYRLFVSQPDTMACCATLCEGE